MSDAMQRLSAALADRYTIERELGAGGMATVYLAEDLKHRRQVAIKVLRSDLAAALGPDRFMQEIEIAARLQHPHILGVHDSGNADGFLYYVMPYVEGESLRERLSRQGELPIHEAVRLLSEVADALGYAHSRGVVHRDIKPENVMVSGRHALVMDFGVAKAVSEASGRNRLTTLGVALGTPAYMAPEQASADPHLDHRVDIYALGVMGYELLAGRPPFTGASPQQVLAAHVMQAPELVSTHRPSISPALASVIMKALEKRPADRWQTAEEMLAQLEPLATPSGGLTPTGTMPIAAGMRAPHRAVVRWIAAGAVALAVIAVLLLRPWQGRRTTTAVTQRQLTFSGDAYGAAISPDGKWLAYISGDTAVLVREVAGGSAVPVLHGSSIRPPVWSPDGGSLLVGAALENDLARDAVWEIPRLGGDPNRVGGNAYSYDYSPDGERIVWAVFDTLGVTERKSGRELRRLIVPGISSIRNVRWSPDGRWVALNAATIDSGRAVFLIDSAGSARHLVSHRSGWLAWSSDSEALYILSGSQIVRQRIDSRTATPQDSAEIVLSGLTGAISGFSVAQDGRTLVLSKGPESSRNVTVTVPTSGNLDGVEAVPLSSGTASVMPPAVSPDGHWVVWGERAGPTWSVLLAPFAGGAPRVVARYEVPLARDLRWAPDSRRFAYFLFGEQSGPELYTATTDGGPPARVAAISTDLTDAVGPSWSWSRQGIVVPDSAKRGYLLVDPSSGRVLPLAPVDSLTRLYTPLLSPDGKTLIVGRWRPYGFANDLWQRRLDEAAWQPLPYDLKGNDFFPLRWDDSGVYIIARPSAGGSAVEILRALSLGAPLTRLIAGLRWCDRADVSLSDDNRHLVCTEVTRTPDVWLVTGFDAER